MSDVSHKKMYKRRKRKKIRRFLVVASLSVVGLFGLYSMFSNCGANQASSTKCPYASGTVEAAPEIESACDDAVTGTWVGEQYLHGYKYQFTLDVQRQTPGSNVLVGNIKSRYWDDATGASNVNQPPTCAQSSEQYIIDMAAVGSVEGNKIQFKGQSWKLSQAVCGTFDSGYLPDGFTGVLGGNEEFSSVNDDGGNPTTQVNFQRVRCETGTSVSPL